MWLLALPAMYATLEAQSQTTATGSSPHLDEPREIQTISPVHDLHSIRILTWNIDRGSHLGVISSELARNPADLCLFQEVDWNAKRSGKRDVAADLAARLHMNLAYAVEFEELSQESGQRAFIGQATLTRLPMRRTRVLRFVRQSGFWKPNRWMPAAIPLMQRRLGGRIALITELEFSGRLLVVYNLHLESRSTGKIQVAQLNEVLADLHNYAPGTPAVIGGDFNTKYFPSIVLRKLERQGFHSATGERIERTHSIAMALDWIFARGVRIDSGTVRHDFHGSDHYPIYAELSAE